MNNRVEWMQVFTRTADSGSFSAAARSLGSTQAKVSKAIAVLACRLGIRLFERTTRAPLLRDEGRQFHQHVHEAIAAAGFAEGSLGKRANPSERLKIACGTALGRNKVAPLLPALCANYPDVQVELALSDYFANLVEEGFDATIRVAELNDSGLIARNVGRARRVCVASPDYLTRRGRPRTPEELREH